MSEIEGLLDRSVQPQVNVHIQRGAAAAWRVYQLSMGTFVVTSANMAVSLYFDDLETARGFRRAIEAVEEGLALREADGMASASQG